MLKIWTWIKTTVLRLEQRVAKTTETIVSDIASKVHELEAHVKSRADEIIGHARTIDVATKAIEVAKDDARKAEHAAKKLGELVGIR